MFILRCKSCQDTFGLTNRRKQCKCKKSAGKQTADRGFSISGRSIVYEIPDRVVNLYDYCGAINVIVDNFSERDMDWIAGDGALYETSTDRQ
jgi:hypothetical protein